MAKITCGMKHMRSASTRLRVEDYERLRVACWCEGYTMHRLIRSFCAWYLRKMYGNDGLSDSLQYADVLMLELLAPSKHD